MNENAIKDLLETLENRFINNMKRHLDIKWETVKTKISNDKDLLNTLLNMEQTGGEVDVINYENELYFIDFSKETPNERRSFCYDKEALDSRKQNKPSNDVLSFCRKIGSELMDEKMYRYIQSIESLDLKTSSWIKTPEKIRSLGGALFCDKRYDTVFTYHNGADSYYSSRGFRTFIKIS